jgi:peroxiredoxin
MQKVVSKCKDNPNVLFLFIDTWETDGDYSAEVKKIISDNKYSFNVLLNEKNDDGKQDKVVTQYDVNSIPTKFIIDKNGNIRFKYIGYEGNTDALINKLTSIIDLVK